MMRMGHKAYWRLRQTLRGVSQRHERRLSNEKLAATVDLPERRPVQSIEGNHTRAQWEVSTP